MRWGIVLWVVPWAVACESGPEGPITDVDDTTARCMAELKEGFPVTLGRAVGRLHDLAFDGTSIWALHSEGDDLIPDATSVSRLSCDGDILVWPIDLSVDGGVPHPAMNQLEVHGDSVVVSTTLGDPQVGPLSTRLLRIERETGDVVAERWLDRGEQRSFGARLVQDGDDLILATPYYDDSSRVLVVTRLAQDLSDLDTLVSLDLPALPMIPPALGVQGSAVLMAWGERVDRGEMYSPFELRVHSASGDQAPVGVVREVTSNVPIHMVTERSGRTLLAWADQQGVRVTEFGVWQDWPLLGGFGEEFSLTLLDGVAYLALSESQGSPSSWIGTISEDGEFEVLYRNPTAVPRVTAAVGEEGLVVGGPLGRGSGNVPWIYGVPR